MQTPYEWPKNTGQVYMALTGILIGGEVVDNYGDTLHIIDIMNYRTSPLGDSWNLEPVPGYCNPTVNQIANSQDPTTWPSFWPDRMNDPSDPGWPGSWDGYLGKNIFVEGQEFYFKISDDLYDHYPDYFPDSTDLTRKGLGLLVSCRAMEFTEPLFEDIAILTYEIKNDGTEPIYKMGFTLWDADFVGGDGDSQDDILDYDLNNNFVWFKDSDGRAPTFGSDPVGMVGTAFLKTPDNINGSGELGITNIQYIPAGGLNINSDPAMWFDFMIPGKYVNLSTIIAGEYDAFASSSYFSLQPGETTEIIIGVIMGNGPDDPAKLADLNQNLDFAKKAYQAGFKFNVLSVEITSPAAADTLSNIATISWTTQGDSGDVISYISYSSSYGLEWELLGIDSLNSGSYSWNTNYFDDGILNKLRIISIAENGMGVKESEGTFVINNTAQNVSPQIFITNPAENEIIEDLYPIKWISGDADGDNYFTNIYYRSRSDQSWESIISGVTVTDSINWDTKSIANSNHSQLLGEVIASSDTGTFLVSQFSIENNHHVIPDSGLYSFTSSVGTGDIEVHVVDSTELTGDVYLLEFNTLLTTGALVYDVSNQTTGSQLVSNAWQTQGIVEGPYFDGVRLLIRNDSLELNTDLSGWTSPDIYSFTFEVFAWSGGNGGKNNAADYLIVFGNVGIDTSVQGTIGSYTSPAIPVNFKVFNTTNNEEIDFMFLEVDNAGGPGMFTFQGAYRDRILFLEKVNSDSLEWTYWVYMNDFSGNRFPTIGDSLFIYQYKPFIAGDSLFFSTNEFTSVKDDLSNIPGDFALDQNYPNPFNPATTITYNLGYAAKVNLQIYNILGQRVTSLINQNQDAGKYSYLWQPKNLSSGIYFIKFEAGPFKSFKKIIYLK